jgi:hypothetical protein
LNTATLILLVPKSATKNWIPTDFIFQLRYLCMNDPACLSGRPSFFQEWFHVNGAFYEKWLCWLCSKFFHFLATGDNYFCFTSDSMRAQIHSFPESSVSCN